MAEATATQELALALSVRSARADQGGPARIFTVSRGPYERDLTVAQEGDGLVVRLRRAGSTENGFPELVVPGVFAEPGVWRRVELVVHRGRLTVTVDGREAVDDDLGQYAIDWWDPTMPVFLGNETTLDRGWEGSIRGAVVEVPSERVDFLAAPLVAPSSRWVVPQIRVGRALDPSDVVLNVLAFVPLGLLVRRGLRAAVLAGAAVSLVMEGGQLLLPVRDPSVVDVAMNTAGAVLGALVAQMNLPSRFQYLSRSSRL